MGAKFTPGPWRAASFSSIVGCPIMAQPDPKKNSGNIACAHGAFGDDYRSEVEANARLIAAAPDLLAALKCSQRHLRTMRVHRGTVGGSCGQCGRTWDDDSEAHHDSCQIVLNAAALSRATETEGE